MKSATRDIVKRYARVKHGYFNVTPISYPEPANFLRRMLDEKEGTGSHSQQIADLLY